MIWPFSKSPRKLQLPPEDDHHWGVVEGEYNGAALIVRFNRTAGEFAGHAGLPLKLGFAIPLNLPNEGGLPDPDENVDLDAIEDVIRREVAAATSGIHVMVLTTGVMKELIFYIAPGADIATLHQSVQNKVTGHEVQCMAVGDPDWESYRAFVP